MKVKIFLAVLLASQAVSVAIAFDQTTEPSQAVSDGVSQSADDISVSSRNVETDGSFDELARSSKPTAELSTSASEATTKKPESFVELSKMSSEGTTEISRGSFEATKYTPGTLVRASKAISKIEATKGTTEVAKIISTVSSEGTQNSLVASKDSSAETTRNLKMEEIKESLVDSTILSFELSTQIPKEFVFGYMDSFKLSADFIDHINPKNIPELTVAATSAAIVVSMLAPLLHYLMDHQAYALETIGAIDDYNRNGYKSPRLYRMIKKIQKKNPNISEEEALEKLDEISKTILKEAEERERKIRERNREVLNN